MKAVEFKNNIKQIKDQLRGLTIQMITKHSTVPHYSLRSFGNAILEQESFGYEFNVSQAWTQDGIITVKSFSDLVELLKTKTVQAIQVCTFEPYNGFGDLVRSGNLD
jgi:ABC-type Zn uptake system ZnuABC Zn-binding protein ZnuA